MRLIRGRYGYRVTWWRRGDTFTCYPPVLDTVIPVDRLGDGRKGNVMCANWRYVQRARTGYRAPRAA